MAQRYHFLNNFCQTNSIADLDAAYNRYRIDIPKSIRFIIIRYNCSERDEDVTPRAMRTRAPASRRTAYSGLYHKHYVILSTTLWAVKVPHVAKTIKCCDRPSNKRQRKLYPGCVTRVVSNMIYSVVTNRLKNTRYELGKGSHLFNRCMPVYVPSIS